MDEITERRILELANSYNAPTIAKMLGIGKRTVYRIFGDHGIKTGQHKCTQSLDAEVEHKICEWYGHLPTVEIADRLSISKTTIYNVCRRHGIDRRSRTRGLRDFHGTDDVDTFSAIDTPEKWYIVGLLCADGTLSGDIFSITLKSSDRYLLEDIRRYIGYGSISDISTERIYRDRPSRSEVSRLRICRRRIVEDLCHHGVRDFKEDKFSFDCDDNEFRYFVHGFFDGDGIAGSRRVGFAGSPGVLASMRDRIYEICGISSNVTRHGSIARMTYGAKRDASVFVDWLYGRDLPQFFLKRKYNKMMKQFGSWESNIEVIWRGGNRFEADRSYLQHTSEDVEHMQRCIAQRLSQSWIPPTYSDDELKQDLIRCRTENLRSYYQGSDRLHSTAPNPGGMPGRRIMTHFNPHFWDVSGGGKKAIPQIWDYYNISHCLGISIKEKESLSLERVLREMFFHCNCFRTSLFAPGFARHIYQEFLDGNKVFDPCGGWGGRLIGAYLEGLEYTCTEISPQTYHGLCSIRDFLRFDCNIRNKSCLTLEWPESDLIFTSPPYYDTEEYIGGDQPHKLESRDAWVSGFVEPFINKINGRCVLYLNGKTLRDFSSVLKPKNVIEITNRKHPRARISGEFLAEW